MNAVKLPQRLKMIAALVKKGTVAIDVGTDHGLIPAWLIQNEICERVIASDIRPGPLGRAIETARSYGIGDKIEFLLCDGLDHPLASKAKTVIIAGMGGHAIAGILERANWINGEVGLILQPMSKQRELRLWLYENGYGITGEYLACEAGKIYSIITARAGGVGECPTPAELMVGRENGRGALFSVYIDSVIRKTNQALRGMALSEKEADTAKAGDLRKTLKSLYEMKGRIEMVKVGDVRNYFEKLFPSSMKMDFDNVGLLVGSSGSPVSKILVSLDITSDVIDEARKFGAELILSHHPLFFSLKRVTDEDREGAKVMRLIGSKISAICLHTNLDAAQGGVNDELIRALGARRLGMLDEAGTSPDGEPYGLGRIGELDESMPFEAFLTDAARALCTKGLRYHDAGRPVSKIAACGGSGGDYLDLAYEKGCDTYVTSDIKYHLFLKAKELGINLIDGDHFCTENVVIEKMKQTAQEGFPGVQVEISRRHGQTVRFYVQSGKI